MGVLREVRTQRQVTLSADVMVGRSVNAPISLNDARVSTQHAALSYQHTGWRVRDLGSRNGTRVDGTPISSDPQAIHCGSRIQFGHPSIEWELVDDAPPRARAREGSSYVDADETGTLYLPPGDRPTISIFFLSDRWIAEQGHSQWHVQDGDEVEEENSSWVLELPPRPGEILASTEMTNAKVTERPLLELHVSLDEEHVGVRYRHQGVIHNLGTRARHYLLLNLARAIDSDRELGMSNEETGWIDCDALRDQLKTSDQHINLMIYRLRKQFRTFGLPPHGVIERRRGQVRLAIPNFEIDRG